MHIQSSISNLSIWLNPWPLEHRYNKKKATTNRRPWFPSVRSTGLSISERSQDSKKVDRPIDVAM